MMDPWILVLPECESLMLGTTTSSLEAESEPCVVTKDLSSKPRRRIPQSVEDSLGVSLIVKASLFRDRSELLRHSKRHSTGDVLPHGKGVPRHDLRSCSLTHLSWSSGKRPHQCTVCEKTFRDRSELNRHSRRHTGDLPYTENFNNNNNTLEENSLGSRPSNDDSTPPSIEPLINTSSCSSGAISNNSLNSSSSVSSPQKSQTSFICSYCSRSFTDKSRYEVHVRFHTGETPYVCPVCNKAFRDDKKMKVHLGRHTSSLTHKCHLCPRSFEGPRALNKHLLAHKMKSYISPKNAVKAQPREGEESGPPTYSRPLPEMHESVLEEKLIQGAAKVVPVPMEEFKNDFPDLLDSSSSVQDTYDKMQNSIPAPLLHHNSAPTFATLSGVEPQYPSHLALKPNALGGGPPIVLARKSAAPPPPPKKEPPKSPPKAVLVSKPEALVTALASEAVAQLAKAKINLPAGTCLVPASEGEAPKSEAPTPILPPAISPHPSQPMTITIQYKIYPDQKGQAPRTVSVKRDLADLIKDNPARSSSQASETSDKTSASSPTPYLQEPAQQPAPPALPPSLKASDPPRKVPAPVDPAKETRTVITSAGNKYEVPTVVTGGYDLDNLLCTFCDRRFKNEKTLMGHMLNHFGVAPKMASCPECGLTLQKKSYARHLRLHGNIAPQVCSLCKKEFKEKRSLEKHIKAAHGGEAAFPCNYCPETFKSPIEQKNHVDTHVYPFECETCHLKFQKAESLQAHLKVHAGEGKPFACEICDKAFNSEKVKRNHVLKHQGSMPYKCEVCFMTFQTRGHLTKHEASHTRQTQVISAKINTFLESFSASLENDMQVIGFDTAESSSGIVTSGGMIFPENIEDDAPEKPREENPTSIDCSLCPAKLASKRSYLIHLKRHVGGLKGFKCKYCDKSFMSKLRLHRHVKNHAKEGTKISPPSSPPSSPKEDNDDDTAFETIKCALCPKTFTDNETIQVHTLSHFEDEVLLSSSSRGHRKLRNTFKRSYRLRSLHRAKKIAAYFKANDILYICRLCDVSLGSKSSWFIHKMKHKGKSLECPECKELYLLSSELVSHLTSTHALSKKEIKSKKILSQSHIYGVEKKMKNQALEAAREEEDDEMEVYSPPQAPHLVSSFSSSSEDPFSPPPPIVVNATPVQGPTETTTMILQSPQLSIPQPEAPVIQVLPMNVSDLYSSGGKYVEKKSIHPGSRLIEDESVFDVHTLSCLACNKTFKNLRNFRVHKSRHQGTLNHKCPECIKTFGGRAAINRHMIAIHGRELLPDEETNQATLSKKYYGAYAPQQIVQVASVCSSAQVVSTIDPSIIQSMEEEQQLQQHAINIPPEMMLQLGSSPPVEPMQINSTVLTDPPQIMIPEVGPPPPPSSVEGKDLSASTISVPIDIPVFQSKPNDETTKEEEVENKPIQEAASSKKEEKKKKKDDDDNPISSSSTSSKPPSSTEETKASSLKADEAFNEILENVIISTESEIVKEKKTDKVASGETTGGEAKNMPALDDDEDNDMEMKESHDSSCSHGENEESTLKIDEGPSSPGELKIAQDEEEEERSEKVVEQKVEMRKEPSLNVGSKTETEEENSNKLEQVLSSSLSSISHSCSEEPIITSHCSDQKGVDEEKTKNEDSLSSSSGSSSGPVRKEEEESIVNSNNEIASSNSNTSSSGSSSESSSSSSSSSTSSNNSSSTSSNSSSSSSSDSSSSSSNSSGLPYSPLLLQNSSVKVSIYNESELDLIKDDMILSSSVQRIESSSSSSTDFSSPELMPSVRVTRRSSSRKPLTTLETAEAQKDKGGEVQEDILPNPLPPPLLTSTPALKRRPGRPPKKRKLDLTDSTNALLTSTSSTTITKEASSETPDKPLSPPPTKPRGRGRPKKNASPSKPPPPPPASKPSKLSCFMKLPRMLKSNDEKKKEEDSSEADKGNRLKIIKESKERILDEEDEEPLKVAESFSEETKNKTDEQTSKEEMPSPVIPKKKRGRKPKYPQPPEPKDEEKDGAKEKIESSVQSGPENKSSKETEQSCELPAKSKDATNDDPKKKRGRKPKYPRPAEPSIQTKDEEKDGSKEKMESSVQSSDESKSSKETEQPCELPAKSKDATNDDPKKKRGRKPKYPRSTEPSIQTKDEEKDGSKEKMESIVQSSDESKSSKETEQPCELPAKSKDATNDYPKKKRGRKPKYPRSTEPSIQTKDEEKDGSKEKMESIVQSSDESKSSKETEQPCELPAISKDATNDDPKKKRGRKPKYPQPAEPSIQTKDEEKDGSKEKIESSVQNSDESKSFKETEQPCELQAKSKDATNDYPKKKRGRKPKYPRSTEPSIQTKDEEKDGSKEKMESSVQSSDESKSSKETEQPCELHAKSKDATNDYAKKKRGRKPKYPRPAEPSIQTKDVEKDGSKEKMESIVQSNDENKSSKEPCELPVKSKDATNEESKVAKEVEASEPLVQKDGVTENAKEPAESSHKLVPQNEDDKEENTKEPKSPHKENDSPKRKGIRNTRTSSKIENKSLEESVDDSNDQRVELRETRRSKRRALLESDIKEPQLSVKNIKQTKRKSKKVDEKSSEDAVSPLKEDSFIKSSSIDESNDGKVNDDASVRTVAKKSDSTESSSSKDAESPKEPRYSEQSSLEKSCEVPSLEAKEEGSHKIGSAEITKGDDAVSEIKESDKSSKEVTTKKYGGEDSIQCPESDKNPEELATDVEARGMEDSTTDIQSDTSIKEIATEKKTSDIEDSAKDIQFSESDRSLKEMVTEKVMSDIEDSTKDIQCPESNEGDKDSTEKKAGDIKDSSKIIQISEPDKIQEVSTPEKEVNDIEDSTKENQCPESDESVEDSTNEKETNDIEDSTTGDQTPESDKSDLTAEKEMKGIEDFTTENQCPESNKTTANLETYPPVQAEESPSKSAEGDKPCKVLDAFIDPPEVTPNRSKGLLPHPETTLPDSEDLLNHREKENRQLENLITSPEESQSLKSDESSSPSRSPPGKRRKKKSFEGPRRRSTRNNHLETPESKVQNGYVPLAFPQEEEEALMGFTMADDSTVKCIKIISVENDDEGSEDRVIEASVTTLEAQVDNLIPRDEDDESHLMPQIFSPQIHREDEQVEKTSHEPRNEDIKEEPITPNESMDMSGEDFIDLEDLDGEPPLLVIKPKVLYRRRKSSFDDRRGSPRRRDNSSQEKEVTVTAATTTKAEDEKPQNDENCDKFDSIPDEPPKKRGRKPKDSLHPEGTAPTVNEKDEKTNVPSDESSVPPKKRGRKKKEGDVPEALSEEGTPSSPPRRRGRPSLKDSPEKQMEEPSSPIKEDSKAMNPQQLKIPSTLFSYSEDKKNKKLFRCSLCQKTFNRKDKINYHIFTDHSGEVSLEEPPKKYTRLNKKIQKLETDITRLLEILEEQRQLKRRRLNAIVGIELHDEEEEHLIRGHEVDIHRRKKEIYMDYRQKKANEKEYAIVKSSEGHSLTLKRKRFSLTDLGNGRLRISSKSLVHQIPEIEEEIEEPPPKKVLVVETSPEPVVETPKVGKKRGRKPKNQLQTPLQEEDKDICLEKGSFQESVIMNAIADENVDVSEGKGGVGKAKKGYELSEIRSPLVQSQSSQLDGNADSLSSSSSLVDEGLALKKKPQNKLAIIRRVFSTYTKKRKFVVVKYRKPLEHFMSLEEYLESLQDGERPREESPEEEFKMAQVDGTFDEEPSRDPPPQTHFLILKRGMATSIRPPPPPTRSGLKTDISSSSSISETFEESNNFVCHICAEGMSTRKAYEAHLSRHRGLSFKCDRCPKAFKDAGDLQLHQSTQHPPNLSEFFKQADLISPEESADFSLPDDLHLFDSSSLMDSSDSVLNLSLDDLPSFYQQEQEFEEASPAASRSETPGSLPPDDGEFPCTHCEKKFGSRRNLMSHMRRHTGDYKVFCDHCGKGFFTKSKMDSHRTKHTGEKPFRCLMKTCLKRFRYKGDLSKHIKRLHPGHRQPLTAVPIQEDELLSLQSASMKKEGGAPPGSLPLIVRVSRSPGGNSTTSSTTTSSSASSSSSSNTTENNKIFLPLLPQHPIKPAELGMSLSKSGLSPVDVDPSLDENLLNMLTSDEGGGAPYSPPSPPAAAVGASAPSPSRPTFQITKTNILHDVLTQNISAKSSFTTNAAAPSSSASAATTSAPPPNKVLNSTSNFIIPSSILKPSYSSQGTPLTLSDVLSSFTSSSSSSPSGSKLINVITVGPKGGRVLVSAASSTAAPPLSPSDLSATALLPARPAKPFPCSHPGCNRSFEKANLLRRHAKLHSGNCKFVCDICKKCFESQSKLDGHYRKHTGEKPFICHVCGNSFRYKGDRTKHLKNIHGVLKSISAPSTPSGDTSAVVLGSSHNNNNNNNTTTSSSHSSLGGGGTSSTSSTPSLLESSSSSSSSSCGSLPLGGDLRSFLISEETTNSSVSSFHSETTSLLEQPLKFNERLDETDQGVGNNILIPHSENNNGGGGESTNTEGTITMSLDEVMQFAQPLVMDYY